MGETERTETYWRNGRLYPVTIYRPQGRGPWKKQTGLSEKDLVATIEGSHGEFKITEGPAATPERINESVLAHFDIEPQKLTTKIWNSVPDEILEKLSHIIHDTERDVSQKWKKFSNEEAITGALFSRLDRQYDFENWEINLNFIEFSKQLKEPKTGTDIAIILDAKTADGQRSFKTLWFQAKREKNFISDPNLLPRFEDQASAAAVFTNDFYGIIYTPQGIFVTGTKLDKSPELHTVIREAMQCRLGDTTIKTLKNSLSRKHIFEITLTET